MHVLERYRLFEGLDPQALDDIAAYARVSQARRGAILFEEHTPAEALYAVQNGWVRLYKLAADGRQSVIRLSGPSDIVGISAVLPEGMYTLAAQAISPCRLLTWRACDLHRLIDRYPVLQRSSLRLLSEYRDHLQQQFLELATEHVEQRLAHALIRLADQYGAPISAPGQVKIPIMQRDLADLIGVSHYTVNRLLHLWQQQGLVQSRRGCVVVTDRQQLLTRAETSFES
ncbi:MAG: Crp/Fnr family transcriptional regulator [Roseiflexus sp.]|jgi:CRP-like cAMP-binding protein|nr:Crp/Fnr family transcriptional regulator [Roseiflexus sp.]MBO9336680.1 Crp/Fnr family transcriptional regulator [Roseiflexus sp.]MBO9341109.1 Crp/Fnr family transcriptional regulator [Roseiflexus sp.]MBO9366035.1 Crp/Fnr family transcriptional regulator [Roseiflexus sp.]MBO9381221.1 Crp/Fnr family transcriptional regulator [Roseiflexus sp.]